jgi:DNA-binding FadR family transcriptional regulator
VRALENAIEERIKWSRHVIREIMKILSQV